MKRIAINGFGRIGRAACKLIVDTPGLELIAVNDLMTLDNAAYLLRHDSVYGTYEKEVTLHHGHLHINGQKVFFLNEPDPAKLPWLDMDIDLVIESTGRLTQKEDAGKHLTAGARRVVLSGPTKSPDIPTIVYGVNSSEATTPIFSCGSCTTNSVAPLIEIIGRRLGILKAILNTVHAFTSSQALVDGPSGKSVRMGRSGAVNLVPASTGAAIAVTRTLPQYDQKFDGTAIRTPVPIGSISDITMLVTRITTPEEINEILTEESGTERYKKVFMVSGEQLVSSDIM